MQVMEELKQITGQTETPEDTIALNWHKWQPKVFPYASLLNKTTVKELAMQVDEDIPNGIATHPMHIRVVTTTVYFLQNAWEF